MADEKKQCPHGIPRDEYCRDCVLAEVKSQVVGLVDECLDERSQALVKDNARLRKENSALQSFYALVPRLEKRLLQLIEILKANGITAPAEDAP